nr:MAG TPA: hypothetical protein [Caudoviricetes sp.]
MAAVGVILKCHHNGTLLRAGGNISRCKVSRRFESGRSEFSLTERKSHYSHTLLKRPVEMQGVL